MGYRSAGSGFVTLSDLIAGAAFEGGVLSIGGDAVLTSALFDQPGGVPHLNDAGELVGPLIPRRLTLADLGAMIPAGGELVTTSDTNQVFLGDGATSGGIEVGKTIPSIFYDADGSTLYMNPDTTALGVRRDGSGNIATFAAAFHADLDENGNFLGSQVSDGWYGMWWFGLDASAGLNAYLEFYGYASFFLHREGDFALNALHGASIWADIGADALNLAGGVNAYYQDGSTPTLTISDAGFTFRTGPVILGPLTAAPASPSPGAIYFSSADTHFYGWNGSAWKQLDN